MPSLSLRINLDPDGRIGPGKIELLEQIAAFGSAGTGYGGSAKGALDETALNQEMDALNTKYKGVLTGYGYGVNSQLDRSRANAAGIAGSLTAGAALLKGAGSNYTFSSMGGG